MQLTATRTTAALMSTALVVSIAGIVVTDRMASAEGRSWTLTATELPSTSDTFVSRESPKQSAGSSTKLVVRDTPRLHRKAYLKFVVPKAVLRNGGEIESAVLELTSIDGARADVAVSTTPQTAWTEAKLAFSKAPRAGTTIARLVRNGAGLNRADVTSAVRGSGTYAFQLTTKGGIARYHSSESKGRAPRLRVTIRRPKSRKPPTGTPTTAPPTTAPPTMAPTTAPPTTRPPTTRPPTTRPPTSAPPTTAPPTTRPPTTAPPTTAPPTTRPPTTPPPTTSPSGKAMLGMSAPNQLWNQRLSEVGSGLEARRLFFTGFTANLSMAQQACDAGTYPVMSFKTAGYTWAQVASGAADADLRALATKLGALSCDVFVAIHHEPEGDGTAADWSAMAVHALPILGGAIGGKVKVGVIGNGWWWSGEARGYTDAEIAAWVTPTVIAVSDVVAGDTYQGDATGEEVATKINRMGAWARRVGGVRALGLGEFNTQTAQGLSNAITALGTDPLFAWGCLWNADGSGAANATVLTGDRLAVFRTALSNW